MADNDITKQLMDARMGFAERNADGVKKADYPIPIVGVGSNWRKQLWQSTPQTGWNNAVCAWQVPGWNVSVPGLMVFYYEKVLSPVKNGNSQLVLPIFNAMWQEIAQNLTGARSTFAPMDLAFRCWGQLQLDELMSVFETALDRVQMIQSQENWFLDADLMLHAMGFTDDSSSDILFNWKKLVGKYNQDVVGRMNGYVNFQNPFPGRQRWPGLAKGLYADIPVPEIAGKKVDDKMYQMYMFVPNSYYTLEINPEQQEIKDALKRENKAKQANEVPLWYMKRHGWSEITSLWTLLEVMTQMVTDLYMDDDADAINTALLALKNKGKSNFALEIGPNDYEAYPEEGHAITIIYDFNMLMAIHNMTIMSNLEPSDVTQDPADFTMSQTFTLNYDPGDTRAYGGTDAFLRSNHIIDLPTTTQNLSDLINAIQWHGVRHPDAYVSDITYEPEILGTDYIAWADIYYYEYTRDQVTHKETKECKKVPFAQCLYLHSDGEYVATNFQFDDLTNAKKMQWLSWSLSKYFNNKPIQYMLNMDGTFETNYIIGPADPLEIPYIARWDYLADAKSYFVWNFYGYPINPTEEGQFNPSWTPEISAEVDTLTSATEPATIATDNVGDSSSTKTSAQTALDKRDAAKYHGRPSSKADSKKKNNKKQDFDSKDDGAAELGAFDSAR